MLRRPVESADRAVIGVEHGPAQAAAFGSSRVQRVLDELGTHVVGQCPADELAREQIDDRGQVEVGAASDRQVGDVPDVAAPRRPSAEVTLDEIGELPPRGLGRSGPDPASQSDAGQAVNAHHARYALVVDPLARAAGSVEISGDPRGPVGPIPALRGVLERRDLRGQGSVVRGPLSATIGPVQPGVEGSSGGLQDLAHPLHLEGVSVVGDELEAGHQFVSPAKYLAA